MNLGRIHRFAPWPLRLALGAVFIVHGLPKFLSTQAVAGFFAQVGIPASFFMTVFIGLVEVLGGALVLVGIGTRFAGLVLALDMVGTIITVKFAQGFVNGWEFDFVLLAAALSLVFSGSTAGKTQEI